MKAKISRDGHLIVSVETDLEAYALERWSDENGNTGDAKIILSWGLESEKIVREASVEK